MTCVDYSTPHHATARKRERITFPLQLSVALLVASVCLPGIGAAAVITGTHATGIGFVNVTSDSTGFAATLGEWDGPYTLGRCGPCGTEFGNPPEPNGFSQLNVTIDVQSGGVATFAYEFATYDADRLKVGNFDWLEIGICANDGCRDIVPLVHSPDQECWGSYWNSGRVQITQNLDQWAHQVITLIFVVNQDGCGDQSQARINGLAIRTCSVPPLTPLSPSAQAFEDDSTRVDSLSMTPATQTALACFRAAVANAGGQVKLESAFRPSDYQLHLQEVWLKWRALVINHEPECADLRAKVLVELVKHHLTKLTEQPAGPRGPHVRGVAFDAIVSVANRDTLASHCGLFRPFPGPCTPPAPHCDPTHYLLR